MTLDRPCHNHPDREAVVFCEKYGRYLCVDCITCREPEHHCKHRPMCLIWDFVKHGIPEELRSGNPNGSGDDE